MLTTSSLIFIQELIETIGIFSFAISGLIAALKKKMDLVGIVMVSGITAFGGGTLRDILLDRRPFYWVEHSYWLVFLIVFSLLSTWFLKTRHVDYTLKMIQVPDAIGLGLFTVLGIQIALISDMPWVVAIFMGVISGTFGGVLRDVACGEMPQLFFDHQPYAVIGFFGGVVNVALFEFIENDVLSMSVTFLVIVILRLLTVYLGWRLPNYQS
jgi:uncharacterized membrane protein YeiH